VRYRVVLELTFPDADRWDCGGHDKFLEQMTIALDFSGLEPGIGHVFEVTCPIAAVDPGELANVWEVIMKAEAGESARVNIALAIGQVLWPESDAQAVIARAFILRALQKHDAVPTAITRAVLEKAACFAIARRP
jgi:hypothetical protein